MTNSSSLSVLLSLLLSYALTVLAQTLPPTITTTSNATLAYVSVGCYNEKNGQGVPAIADLMDADDTNLTISKCAGIAAAKGYNVFALAGGRWCYGGLSPNYTVYGTSSSCDVPCAGPGGGLGCGGFGGGGANSVYKLYSYLGCYNEKNAHGDPAITDLMDADDRNLTITSCADIAITHGYNTFALAGGQWCYGGLNPLYSQYNASTSCNTQCAGTGGGYGCGGSGANSVYTFYPTTTPTTVPPTTAVPTTITPTTIPPTTAVPTNATVTTAVPTTAVPTTLAPTTVSVTTQVPTTVAITTSVPTTLTPTTLSPTTNAPTTVAPTTAVPTTVNTTTAVPTTTAPNTTVHVNSTSACSSSTQFLCDAINPALPLYFSITVVGAAVVTTGVIGAISYFYGQPLSIAYHRLFSTAATFAV